MKNSIIYIYINDTECNLKISSHPTELNEKKFLFKKLNYLLKNIFHERARSSYFSYLYRFIFNFFRSGIHLLENT